MECQALMVTPVVAKGTTTYDIRMFRVEHRNGYESDYQAMRTGSRGLNAPSARAATTIILRSDIAREILAVGGSIEAEYCVTDRLEDWTCKMPFGLSQKDGPLLEQLQDALCTAARMRPLAGNVDTTR